MATFRAATAIGKEILIGLDPAVNLASTYASAEGLVVTEGGKKIKLSPKGKKLAKELLNADALAAQKEFLLSVGKIPESDVNRYVG